MKLTINQDINNTEDEVVIKCAYADERITRMIDYIRQLFFSLEGEKEGRTYQIPVEGIFYADSVDGKTFIYNRNLLGGLYRENPVKSRNYEAVKSSKKWENVGNSYIIPALLLYRYSYI